ncbi:hypothetical protein ADUPG1_013437 [Aduncisulcus paluster]|uniref:Protein kinase A anchor protein nuclear localisation signal domain-containing protein n=1 Tax=Aduncisulcus paluster TaxID=2918883 RepID=A0ABQ5K304_9EUKA|nr:hypothetical protein ADUPG1_013437 [Aduncisulcus paluster]
MSTDSAQSSSSRRFATLQRKKPVKPPRPTHFIGLFVKNIPEEWYTQTFQAIIKSTPLNQKKGMMLFEGHKVQPYDCLHITLGVMSTPSKEEQDRVISLISKALPDIVATITKISASQSSIDELLKGFDKLSVSPQPPKAVDVACPIKIRGSYADICSSPLSSSPQLDTKSISSGSLGQTDPRSKTSKPITPVSVDVCERGVFMKLNRIGHFGSTMKTHTVFVSPSSPFITAIHDVLVDGGAIPRDPRPYVAHLSVLRSPSDRRLCYNTTKLPSTLSEVGVMPHSLSHSDVDLRFCKMGPVKDEETGKTIYFPLKTWEFF